jgi:hypothetical protein
MHFFSMQRSFFAQSPWPQQSKSQQAESEMAVITSNITERNITVFMMLSPSVDNITSRLLW